MNKKFLLKTKNISEIRADFKEPEDSTTTWKFTRIL